MQAFPMLQSYIRMCEDGWLQGWHERNAGNLTYRMREEEVEAAKASFTFERPWVSMGVQAANLSGAHFITTGTGRFFRNIPLNPEYNIGIVEINAGGDAWRIVWGLTENGQPTSEFPSHFMNHSVRMEATSGACRVIYHAHTPALAALTYVLPPEDKAFTQVLWRSATECPVVFPSGVGVVPWMVPGKADIALFTCEKMRLYESVIWVHHGLFASGPDFDTAFGLMHTIEKAADIHLRAMSCGGGIRYTISDEQIRAIARDFDLELNESLLG